MHHRLACLVAFARPAALVLLLGFLLSACGDRMTAVDRGNRDGILHYALAGEPRDLDPQAITAFNDMKITLALFEGLTAADEATSQPAPAAATKWDVSPDRLTWTFHLRPDLKWSDGTALTARDFVFSFRRTLSPAFGSEYAYVLYPIAGAEAFNSGELTDFEQVGVKATDDLTLVLTLYRPNSALAAILALPVAFPVPEHVITAGGQAFDDRANPWTRPGKLVGNGPFVLTAWEPNQRIVTARNPLFRDDANNRLNGVVFYPFDNASAQEAAFRAGQLHLTSDVPMAKLAAYRQKNSNLLRTDPFIETGFIRFNTGRPPLDDPRVRRALSLAINREAIARNVLTGGQAPAHRFTPPDTAGYTSTATVTQDLDAARALLAEAGYPGGQGFPAFELMTFTTEANQRVMETVQQMWNRELGISIGLLVKEQRVWLNDEHQRNYDLSLGRWIGDYVDPSTFLELFLSNSGNNNTGWGDPEFDRLVNTASAEADTTTRLALYDAAESRLLAAAPVAPIYHGTQTFLIHPAVRGWTKALLGFHRYQFVSLAP